MNTLPEAIVERGFEKGPVEPWLNSVDLDVLCRSHLFRSISRERLQQCLRPTGEICIRSGDALLELGQRNDALYLLMSGRLAVYIDDDARIPLAYLEPGECVGEISIIDAEAASASVIAVEASRLLVTRASDLWDCMAREPTIGVNLLHILAERIRRNNASVLASLSQHAQVGMLPGIDPVTGLHNRRWMNDVFVRQIDRCSRARLAVCLAVVDIDGFRSINDTFGHQVGDRVLAQIGRVLQRQFRPTDLLARYGDEEFAVLLPETRAQDACVALERLRLALSRTQTSVAQRTTVKVTVSVGIAQWRADWSLDDLVDCAERALARAKASGRNCVVVGEPAA